MDDPNTHPDSGPSDPVELPGDLGADVRALFRVPEGVPGRVDAHVRAAAGGVRPVRRSGRTVLMRACAIAASIALVGAVSVVFLRMQSQPRGVQFSAGAGFLIEDVDRSGRVDIVDAFVLRTSLQKGTPVDHAFDVTGDGSVDGSDVDAVAMAAVRLGRPGAAGGAG